MAMVFIFSVDLKQKQ